MVRSEIVPALIDDLPLPSDTGKRIFGKLVREVIKIEVDERVGEEVERVLIAGVRSLIRRCDLPVLIERIVEALASDTIECAVELRIAYESLDDLECRIRILCLR